MLSSLDDYIASKKQVVPLIKTTTRTTVATGWFSMFDVAGQPGAGVLAGGEASPPDLGVGRVPTDAIPGYPDIRAFDAGATGYLSRIEFANTVACRLALFDRLWVGGAYGFGAAQAVTSPSFSSRVPDGDYRALELWVEQVTAATGNQAVNISYLDQDGNAGSTGAVGIGAAPTVGRCWQLPLAAGDSGLQSITNVAGSVATAGTFNVMVLRPLWQGRIIAANAGEIHDMLRTGLPRLYEDSALFMLVNADSTSSGLPDLALEIANK